MRFHPLAVLAVAFALCVRAISSDCICRLATEATFATQSNDPAGFSLVDLMAYGSLGHALGFLLLATSSLGTKPIPF